MSPAGAGRTAVGIPPDERSGLGDGSFLGSGAGTRASGDAGSSGSVGAIDGSITTAFAGGAAGGSITVSFPGEIGSGVTAPVVSMAPDRGCRANGRSVRSTGSRSGAGGGEAAFSL